MLNAEGEKPSEPTAGKEAETITAHATATDRWREEERAMMIICAALGHLSEDARRRVLRSALVFYDVPA